MAMGRACAVHVHRDDVPIEVHHVWPLGNGGPDVPANRVSVCSNGHSAIHDLLSKVIRAKSWTAVPWLTRMRYGRRVRRYALQGWQQIEQARK